MTDLIKIVKIQDEKELEFKKLTENMDALLEGREIIITSQEDLLRIHGLVVKLKAKWKELEILRKAELAPVKVITANIAKRYEGPQDWLLEKEKIAKKVEAEYIDKERLRLKAIQDKLNEQARKEEEKKKQALEERAKKAETNGNLEKAEDLREKAENLQVMSAVINTEMTGKPPTRENWIGIVENFALLPDPYKVINQSAINKTAQATKGKQSIPGVVFKCETIIIGK